MLNHGYFRMGAEGEGWTGHWRGVTGGPGEIPRTLKASHPTLNAWNSVPLNPPLIQMTSLSSLLQSCRFLKRESPRTVCGQADKETLCQYLLTLQQDSSSLVLSSNTDGGR